MSDGIRRKLGGILKKRRKGAAKEGKTARLNPILKVFLEGVYDEECALFKLNGLWHLLKEIWENVKEYWIKNLIETRSVRNKDKFDKGDLISYLNLNHPIDYQKFPFLRGCAIDFGDGRGISFPKPSNININMMPFILERDFKKCRLPDYLKSYWGHLILLCQFDDDEIGKVCYLTIHESKVDKDCSQRRPGLHTERPGKLELRSGSHDGREKGSGMTEVQDNRIYHHWGMGIGSYDKNSFKIKGGIFMASNVDDSCQVWDCQVMDDNLIGHLGDVEHLRSLLPESEMMKANCIYWITDRTPHESLPLKKDTFRQYFRLVTSQVSLWFEEHSTENPLGVVPDPKITKIVKGSKFNKGEAYIA